MIMMPNKNDILMIMMTNKNDIIDRRQWHMKHRTQSKKKKIKFGSGKRNYDPSEESKSKI
jgi:hypothetical protein